jgi:fucose permease
MQSNNNRTPRAKVNVLMLAYIAFVMLGLPTGLLGVAWPTMRTDFALPLDAMGLLLISSPEGYFLASFFIARLINRFGIGSLLIFPSLASAVASFGYPLAPAWSVIVGIGVLAGFGSGVMDAGLNTYLAAEYKETEMQWLPAHRVRLDTLMISAMSLALAGSILFWWNPLPLAEVLGVFVVGFAMAPVFPGLISSTSQRVGEHHAANTIDIQMSAAGLGGPSCPPRPAGWWDTPIWPFQSDPGSKLTG